MLACQRRWCSSRKPSDARHPATAVVLLILTVLESEDVHGAAPYAWESFTFLVIEADSPFVNPLVVEWVTERRTRLKEWFGTAASITAYRPPRRSRLTKTRNQALVTFHDLSVYPEIQVPKDDKPR